MKREQRHKILTERKLLATAMIDNEALAQDAQALKLVKEQVVRQLAQGISEAAIKKEANDFLTTYSISCYILSTKELTSLFNYISKLEYELEFKTERLHALAGW